LEEERASRLMGTIARYNQDDQLEDRLDCLRSTYARGPGLPNAAWTALAEIISNKVVEKLRQWVGKGDLMVQPGNDRTQIITSPYFSIQDMRTDAESAKVFAANFADLLIYEAESRQWLSRHNDVYVKIPGAMVQKIVTEFLMDTAKSYPIVDYQLTKKLLSMASIKSTQELARGRLIRPSSDFDTNEFFVGTEKGVIDLRLAQTVTPDSIVTKRLGTILDPPAKCPQWESFVSAIFAEDADKIAFVRRALGYTLTGSTAEQCLFILTGDGANGKSTLLKVASAMLGDYATITPMQTLMISRYGSEKNEDLAALRGKRLVCASEGELGQKLAEAKIKLMTGGEEISCRFLYGNLFRYQPQFKLWLATNDLPNISGTDEAIWRRIHVIKFPVTFTKEQRDLNLYNKLETELPGILNWTLAGFADWQKQGLNPPPCILEATGAFRTDNDTVGQFVQVACQERKGARTLNSVLFDAYQQWCSNSGYEPVGISQFGKELTRLRFNSYKSNSGNGRFDIELIFPPADPY